MSESQKSVAIITGASSGLGEEFVKQLATDSHFDEFWILARRKARLEDLAMRIESFEKSTGQTHRHKVKVISLDLAKNSELENFKNLLASEKPRVRWLINNAGFGLVGSFEKLDLDKQVEMIDLNIKALTYLTGITLPYMQKGDRMILTASTAGFFPLPQFAVYAATKAYVVSFANALASELKSKGIHVTALCPGPVSTEFFAVAYPAGKSTQKLPMASAQDVVKTALKDARKGSMRSTHGLVYELMVVLSGLIPRRLLLSPIRKAFEKLPQVLDSETYRK
jgi:short-subunit dehydrogenase